MLIILITQIILIILKIPIATVSIIGIDEGVNEVASTGANRTRVTRRGMSGKSDLTVQNSVPCCFCRCSRGQVSFQEASGNCSRGWDWKRDEGSDGQIETLRAHNQQNRRTASVLPNPNDPQPSAPPPL